MLCDQREYWIELAFLSKTQAWKIGSATSSLLSTNSLLKSETCSCVNIRTSYLLSWVTLSDKLNIGRDGMIGVWDEDGDGEVTLGGDKDTEGEALQLLLCMSRRFFRILLQQILQVTVFPDQ